MDEFMSTLLASIGEHGSRAVRVFPPPAQVIIYFAERLANEVVRTKCNCYPAFTNGL